MKKRETVGKISSDLLKKIPETRSPIELQREMQKGYIDNVIFTIKQKIKETTDDFYVIVITKKEPLMQNVLRNYFFTRSTCPTPDYDQAVYKYHAQQEALEFMWVIPSKDTCLILKDYALQVPPEEKQLLHFVLEFADGSLFKKCKKLNGEKVDSIVLNKD